MAFWDETMLCSLFVFFFLVFVVIIIVVSFFGQLFLALFVFFHFVVIRNDVHMHRVSLRDFHLRLTLRTAQDLPLFHFVFIHVQFGSTIRAADHGHFLRREFPRLGVTHRAAPTIQRIIYRARASQIQTHSLLRQDVSRSLPSLQNAFPSRISG